MFNKILKNDHAANLRTGDISVERKERERGRNGRLTNKTYTVCMFTNFFLKKMNLSIFKYTQTQTMTATKKKKNYGPGGRGVIFREKNSEDDEI